LVAVRLEHLEVPGGFYARVAAAAALATAAALLAAFVAGPSYMGGVITAAIAVGATVVLYRFLHCLGGQDRDIVARLNLPGAQRVLRFFHV
jgi:membrane protein implicated in regulation of membrane protease activity